MANRNAVRLRRFSCARRNVTPSLYNAIKRTPINFQIALYRERGCPERFHINGIAVFESPHMELAGSRIRKRTVRPPVYHDAALTTNALAAVVIELHRPLLLLDKLLIEHVQHFQERHVRGYTLQAIVDKAALLAPTFLAPNFELNSHRSTRLFVASHTWRYKIEAQRFLVPDWFLARTSPLPGGGKREILIITNRFPIGRLMFFAEMSPARFFSC